jgi:hypothetical protein
LLYSSKRYNFWREPLLFGFSGRQCVNKASLHGDFGRFDALMRVRNWAFDMCGTSAKLEKVMYDRTDVNITLEVLQAVEWIFGRGLLQPATPLLPSVRLYQGAQRSMSMYCDNLIERMRSIPF